MQHHHVLEMQQEGFGPSFWPRNKKGLVFHFGMANHHVLAIRQRYRLNLELNIALRKKARREGEVRVTKFLRFSQQEITRKSTS
jgi:hypothetical protein